MRMVVATDDKQRGSPDPGKDGIAEDLADEASWDLPSPERIGKKRGRGRTSVGERELFLSVIEDHDRKLRMLAYRLLGDRDQMDDVLQEAYLRAYRHLDDFRGDASLSTWVYRITYNVCLDRLRSSHPDEPVDPSSIDRLNLPVAVATDPADIVGERADVAAALASLPPSNVRPCSW
jgi:RNA polymerase sigma factor (sigma-70 family)